MRGLRYTDNSRGVCILYPTRIGYGYVMDMAWIRIQSVLKILDTYSLRYMYPIHTENIGYVFTQIRVSDTYGPN